MMKQQTYSKRVGSSFSEQFSQDYAMAIAYREKPSSNTNLLIWSYRDLKKAIGYNVSLFLCVFASP